MVEFFYKDQDFYDYVMKYATKTKISVEEALTHSVVRAAYEYYKEQKNSLHK